jgi:hypothetical protein
MTDDSSMQACPLCGAVTSRTTAREVAWMPPAVVAAML